MSTELIEHKTATALANIYLQAEKDIQEAYRLLESAQNQLCTGFSASSYRFNPNLRNCWDVGEKASKQVMKEIKKNAWRGIIERMGVKQLLSVDRKDKLDDQLSTGEGLPDISETAIIVMLEETALNIDEYMTEAVKEIFDFLRPRNSKLKTNSSFEIGKRVILNSAVESGYNSAYRINSYRDGLFTALDNVFLRLDGQGVLKTHTGPLYNAIEASQDGTGQTDYFKFRACRNGNLHIEFLRPDLVQELNRRGGGAQLKS